ncbi:MAG TPA: glycosyltransferase family 39 protein [Xenococcaceae cyanobacterium]
MSLNSKSYSYLSLALIVFGALARLRLYFDNRSLWFDEASLAVNIVNRSYQELINSLEYNQAAPPLFVWLEKFAVQVFGNNESALRLLPLVASLVALWLFYRLVNQYISNLAGPIAIALFATLRYIVDYSLEVKPYATDLTMALILFLVLSSLLGKVLRWQQVLVLSFLGTVAIWLSYPSIFILSAVELVGWLRSGVSKFQAILLNRLPIYLTWLVSFGLLYWLNIQPTMTNETLVTSWSPRYPNSPFDLLALLNELGKFFYKPLGFVGISDGIAIFAFICGCIALYLRHKSHLFLLIAPMVMTLFATYLHKYPFRGRLILFLTPFAIAIIAEGIAFLVTRNQSRYLQVLGWLIALALLFTPVMRTNRAIANPSSFQFDHLRPAIKYFQSYQQSGDILYIFPNSEPVVRYYAEKYQIAPQDYTVGQIKLPETQDEMSPEKWQQYQQAIDQFRGQSRVWFLLARSSSEERQLLLQKLERIGTQLAVFQQPDVVICLYDLS